MERSRYKVVGCWSRSKEQDLIAKSVTSKCTLLSVLAVGIHFLSNHRKVHLVCKVQVLSGLDGRLFMQAVAIFLGKCGLRKMPDSRDGY